MSANSVLDLTQSLEKIAAQARTLLQQFSLSPRFSADISSIFGQDVDLNQAQVIIQELATSNLIIPVNIRLASELQGANGAFAALTDSIYLNQQFLEQNNLATVTQVLLEEIGHAIDHRLNAEDTPGDEGQLFASVVEGIIPDSVTLSQILGEDDTATLTLDGMQIQVEQSTPGVNPAFDLIGLTQLRNDPRFAGIDGSGFSVAIIDSGLDATHPDIRPNFAAFVDFASNNRSVITNPNQTSYKHPHGTHVAGTVGSPNENIGVAPAVKLIGLQVGTGGTSVSNTFTEAALQWVIDNRSTYNITAVNMSLGGGFYTSPGEASGDPRIDEIRELERLGVTVVSSTGNAYTEAQYPNVGSPAIHSTLAVGAVWQDGDSLGAYLGKQVAGSDRITLFSQRLNAPNIIFAPGAMINSTVPNGGYDRWPGTSMASPHVAGAVALMQEAAQQFGGRTLAPLEIVEIMRSTAVAVFDGDDEDDVVTNTNISYPRLNIYNAISEIQRRFGNQGGGNPDNNGTLTGAILGPTLDGSPVGALSGSIGTDGTSTNIGATDVDMYRFQVASPGAITINVGGNTFDSILRIFDQGGNEIAANNNQVQVNLNPGTYYAGVSGAPNRSYNPTVAGSGVQGATGNYSLQFGLGNSDPNGIVSGAVEIDLGTDKEPLKLLQGLIGADYGQPVGTGDVDLFQIVVPDNGTLFIDIDSPFADGEQVDSYLRIFEVVNGQVRQAVFQDTGARVVSDDDLAPDEELFGEEVYDSDGTFVGYRTDSYIEGTVGRGDVYYIGVSDYENQNYDPNTLNGRSTAEPGGFYNLIVTFANNDLNGSITQARTDASLPITNFPGIIGADGNPQTGELRQVGNKDVDFRRITSTTAGILEVDIDSYTVSQISDPVDTVAFIFDAEGNLLASNDDDPDSVDPRLQLQIAANTPYYVAVTGYGNDNFDPFALGSGTGGDTGEYRFNSRLLPSSQAAVLSDNTSNSGSVEAIALNSSLSGNVGVDGSFITGATDVDIYRFVSPVTGVVEISTNTNQTFSADTFLRFFDRSGNEIAFNDNESNATRGSRLRVNVNANTEYLIGVNGYSANARDYNPITGAGAAPGSRGTYTLSLEQSVDPANYGASHPDLIRGIGYNLEALLNHYRNSGRAEGRATDTFDEYRYIASNPDLINAFGVNGPAALEHYIRSGFLENRPTTTFDPEQYLASYPDLINALRYNPAAATNHYIASGFAEGRSPDAFPENRYVAGYDDLLNVFASNPSAATQHYITNGWGEGRSPYAFNPDLYIASYPDLIQALRYNLEQGTQHYINSGRWEGRSRGIFNPVNYLARYGDLRAAFGNNLELATRHYIESGFFEGRSDHE